MYIQFQAAPEQSFNETSFLPPPPSAMINRPDLNGNSGQEEPSNTTMAIVDILAIGSRTRLQNLEMQRNTFASHVSVRNFFNATEDDDVDPFCQSNLTERDVQNIIGFCRAKTNKIMSKYFLPKTIERRKADPSGWLCAQTRPAIGFHEAIQHYATIGESLPDYFIIMDDDTYFNVELFLQYTVQKKKDSSRSFAIAGCLMNFPQKFTFPYGGYGFIISKGSLEKIMLPIVDDDCGGGGAVKSKQHCDDGTILDHMDEKRLFQPGRNMADVLYSYATDQPMSDYQNWKDGFCVHSDW
jgi:hypothetical protein